MSFLLDTSVVSEIRKKTPDKGVVSWFASVPADRLFLSVLVVGEIRQGTARLARQDHAQAENFEYWLSQLTDVTAIALSRSPPRLPRSGDVSTSRTRYQSLMA